MHEYRVQAFNTGADSENKIHDDAVARQFGFRGGLVPGVDVYAYFTHPVVARWGAAWLERGAIWVRFSHPVYDGEEATIAIAPDGDAALALELRDPRGALCATAEASLPAAAPGAPDPGDYPLAPLPTAPPRASAETLASGTVLGSFEFSARAAGAEAYLAAVRETLPLYRAERIVHPGALLRSANYILAQNVQLGPWIHVGSTVQNLGLARVGDLVRTRGRVTATYERRGHHFVELDLLVAAGAAQRPIAHIRHTAIYQPRQQ